MTEENQGVYLSKDQYEQLLNRIGTLEDTAPRAMEKPKYNTVTLRRWNEDLVIGYSKTYSKKDSSNEMKLYWKVTLLTEGKEVEVEYLEFLRNAEYVTCKVVERKTQEIVESTERAEYSRVDESYRVIHSGHSVPLEVTSVKTDFVIELPTGDSLEINERYVNI